MNRGSFSSRRSRPRPWLTAEGERLSRSAARPTWRSSRTTSNSMRRFRSVLLRSILFNIPLKSYHWLQHSRSGNGVFGGDAMTAPNPCTVPAHAARLDRLQRLARRIAGVALAAMILSSATPVRADAVADWYAVVQGVRERVPPASDPAVEQVSPLVALAMYD